MARLYETYPHYDQVFAPLYELAERCSVGGWNAEANISNRIRVLFTGNGSAGCFKLLPRLGRHWADCDWLVGQTADKIRSSLIDFQRINYSWQGDPYCGRCAWRHICGGLDLPDQGRTGQGEEFAAQDLICSYRTLCLEVFARQRLQRGVIPIAELK